MNATTAIATVVLALASIIALIIETRRTRFVQQIDLLLRREELFENDTMRCRRIKAAQAILVNSTGSDLDPEEFRTKVDEVLEFFETLGYLTRCKALNDKAVWGVFSYWVLRYMSALEDYVQEWQRDDPTVWEDAKWLRDRLRAIEKRERKCSDAQVAVSEDEVRRFLVEETSLVLGNHGAREGTVVDTPARES